MDHSTNCLSVRSSSGNTQHVILAQELVSKQLADCFRRLLYCSGRPRPIWLIVVYLFHQCCFHGWLVCLASTLIVHLWAPNGGMGREGGILTTTQTSFDDKSKRGNIWENRTVRLISAEAYHVLIFDYPAFSEISTCFHGFLPFV